MDDIPALPVDENTQLLYYKLRWLYILGFLEALLGVAIIVIEITAIALFYDALLSFPLEITGILLGVFVFISGVISFYAGRRNVQPATRRRLFIFGAISSLISLCSLIAMFVICVLWTHYRYEEVRTNRNRFPLHEEDVGPPLPYVLSMEGSSHMAHLRAVAAAVYLLALLFFAVSVILHVVNIRKNKANIQTNGVYRPVEKNETVIYNNQKSAISTKEDLPWIDQN